MNIYRKNNAYLLVKFKIIEKNIFIKFNKNVIKSFKNNVLATKNLVRFAFQKKNTKLIFASSAAVYGKVCRDKISEKNDCQPANYYGFSKLVSENIINYALQNNKNSYAILRYFNVVGSIVDFKIKKKKKKILGNLLSRYLMSLFYQKCAVEVWVKQ
mgnify:CR=1 FL=1